MAFSCRHFLFIMLLYFPLETLSHPVGNPTHQVKGILGGSVLFPANVSQGITVEKIEWDFLTQMGSLGFWLGEFSNGKLEHPGPTDRFGQRLDMVDETTLRLKDLELDDGGIYNTRIWFTKAQFQEQSFSLTVSETLSHAVGNPPQQVNGILGGSVSFLSNVSQGITVEKIEWDFLPKYGGLGLRLSEYRRGKPDDPNPTDQFGERLDMANQKVLRIKDLELNDSGRYRARVWFTKVQFQEQSFSLTVYKPVPTPQIDHQVESKTPGGCNVTLQCHTPEREELKVSWETGNLHRALGKSVNQYQVSDNGRELRVFYWNSSFDSKFTCLVSNPVDQKGASFDLLNICQSYEGGQFGLSSWIPWLSASLIVLLVMMVMVMWMCWKIRLERNRRDLTLHPTDRHGRSGTSPGATAEEFIEGPSGESAIEDHPL